MEKNNTHDKNFVLSQPHYDSYLNNYLYNGEKQYNPNMRCYSSNFIRNNSNLSFNKKIALFKKFQKIFDRGSLFTLETNQNETSLLNSLKSVIDSKISAVLLKDSIQ